MQRDAARELWAKGGGYNPACNTRGVVTMEADLKTLLTNTISYNVIRSMLEHGATRADQMAMLLGAFDEEKAAAVEANGSRVFEGRDLSKKLSAKLATSSKPSCARQMASPTWRCSRRPFKCRY